MGQTELWAWAQEPGTPEEMPSHTASASLGLSSWGGHFPQGEILPPVLWLGGWQLGCQHSGSQVRKRLQNLTLQGVDFHFIAYFLQSSLPFQYICLNLESLNSTPFHFPLEWVTLLPVVQKGIQGLTNSFSEFQPISLFTALPLSPALRDNWHHNSWESAGLRSRVLLLGFPLCQQDGFSFLWSARSVSNCPSAVWLPKSDWHPSTAVQLPAVVSPRVLFFLRVLCLI